MLAIRQCLVVAALAACGDNLVGDDDSDPIADLEVKIVGALAPDAMSIAAMDAKRIAVARAVASGDAFCPDCVDLDPSQCPAICERTHISVAVLDATTGALGDEIPIAQVFPRSFDHDVSFIDAVHLGGERVGVAWLDCDNARCSGLFAKQSCTARYAVVDLATGATSPTATLYSDRFGRLQLVARPDSAQVLAVTGMTYGSYGAGVRAAVFRDTGEPVSPWLALGGTDALAPAAAATDTGFAVVIDDRRPNDAPPATPCPTSCDCFGAIAVDPMLGGVYAYELGTTGELVRRDAIAIGLTQDGHLPGGHYHDRQVLAVMARGDELAIAATQAIDMEAELFVGRGGTWMRRGGFDSPIPLWIGVMGSPDAVAWLGSQPEAQGQATINRIVAGIATDTAEIYGALTEPLDSHVFEVAPLATPNGISTTFLLRGVFDRSGPQIEWQQFDVLRVQSTGN